MSRLDKLQEFLAKDPTDSLTRYMIGLEYGSQKNYQAAIETLESLRTSDPNYVATYYQLASFYREEDRIEQARDVYTEGIRVARKMNDLHAASELEAALDELS